MAKEHNYTAVYLEFGRDRWEKKNIAKFSTKKMADLDELNLFNHHADESELGEVFYLRWYENRVGEPALYCIPVRPGNEELAKKKLLEAAKETIQERIDEDMAIMKILKQKEK